MSMAAFATFVTRVPGVDRMNDAQGSLRITCASLSGMPTAGPAQLLGTTGVRPEARKLMVFTPCRTGYRVVAKQSPTDTTFGLVYQPLTVRPARTT